MENHTPAAASAPSDSKDPSAFLGEIIGVPVTVKLNSGIVYTGKLHFVQQGMLILLDLQENSSRLMGT